MQARGGSELFVQLKPAGHGSQIDTCKQTAIKLKHFCIIHSINFIALPATPSWSTNSMTE